MERRKFLIGIGSASIGGSALLGSGAFTRVESQRQVTIEVAEDPDAYLGLDGCPDSPNQSYTEIDDSGHLAVEMSPDNPTEAGGEGINSDSRSYFDDVFQICNQGKQEVCVWIEDSGFPVYDGPFGEESRVEFYTGGSSGAQSLVDLEDRSVVGESNGVTLEVGECICVGIATVSKELDEGDQILSELDDEIVIHADEDGDCEREVQCARIFGEYRCTTYEEENGNWRRTGTAFTIENRGGEASDFALAVSDSPGDYRELTIGPNTSEIRISDASVPTRGLIVWDAGDDCREIVLQDPEIRTWGEVKEEEGWDNLNDFYEDEERRLAAGAPEDFDDELITEVKDIPEEEAPDEDIPDEQYPDMDPDAEAAGWISCDKFEQD